MSHELTAYNVRAVAIRSVRDYVLPLLDITSIKLFVKKTRIIQIHLKFPQSETNNYHPGSKS